MGICYQYGLTRTICTHYNINYKLLSRTSNISKESKKKGFFVKNLILSQIIAVVVLFTAGVSGGSDPEYWPTWRGPNMMGIHAEGNPPVKWSGSENIKWKVKLTGDGSGSSPIIWKDKIFFQTAVDTNRKGKDAPKKEFNSRITITGVENRLLI